MKKKKKNDNRYNILDIAAQLIYRLKNTYQNVSVGCSVFCNKFNLNLWFIKERFDFTSVAASIDALLLISLHNVLTLKLVSPTHFTFV
jgi:hypothetical protein